MEYLISTILGFLIGITPQYIFTRKNLESNIFNTDLSQNVVRILFELLKGILLVFVIKEILEFEFMHIMIGLIIVTLSHSLIEGFKYKIREGQFVAIGGLLLLIPSVPLIWAVIWLVSYIYKRNFNFSLISSTFLTGLLCATSSRMFNSEYWYTNPTAESNLEFIFLTGMLFGIVLFTQIDNFKSYFLRNKKKGDIK